MVSTGIGGMGGLGQAVGIGQPVQLGGGGMGASTTWTGISQPQWGADNHQFNCQKVENGWTLNYRGKNYIAADLDSLMDQIKAAMVLDRIEK